MRGRTVTEIEVPDEDWEDHIIEEPRETHRWTERRDLRAVKFASDNTGPAHPEVMAALAARQ